MASQISPAESPDQARASARNAHENVLVLIRSEEGRRGQGGRARPRIWGVLGPPPSPARYLGARTMEWKGMESSACLIKVSLSGARAWSVEKS
eukprot:scaffold105193_cov24-Tisochrysis_lutea.AAC.1